MSGRLDGLSQADAIRAALDALGPGAARGAVVAWLADNGRPGVAPNRVNDVLARQRRAEARHAARETAPGGEAWADEGEPIACPAEGLAGADCPKCGGPLYWTGAQTTVACPACSDVWLRSPGAVERITAMATSPAWAPRRRVTGPERAERDQFDRQAHAERRRFGRALDQLAAIRGLAPEGLDMLDAYRAQARATEGLAPGAALTRLRQLADDLAAETLPRRHWWQAPADIGELDAWADDDDGDEGEQLGDLDGDAGPRALPAGPPAVRRCQPCQHAGKRTTATIRAEDPKGLVPPSDVCDSCFVTMRAASLPVIAVRRYDTPDRLVPVLRGHYVTWEMPPP